MLSEQRKFIDRHTHERLLPSWGMATTFFAVLYAGLAIWRSTGSNAALLVGLIVTTALAVYVTKQIWRILLLRDYRLATRHDAHAYQPSIYHKAMVGAFVVIYITLLYAYVYVFTHWV